jgi:hypothetical protein
MLRRQAVVQDVLLQVPLAKFVELVKFLWVVPTNVQIALLIHTQALRALLRAKVVESDISLMPDLRIAGVVQQGNQLVRQQCNLPNDHQGSLQVDHPQIQLGSRLPAHLSNPLHSPLDFHHPNPLPILPILAHNHLGSRHECLPCSLADSRRDNRLLSQLTNHLTNLRFNQPSNLTNDPHFNHRNNHLTNLPKSPHYNH